MSGPEQPAGSPWEVLAVFTRLGFTSFGGPVAHLGYFRAELVERRAWVDEATYADVVALGQFLPGPASSQVGIALGTARAGLLGGFMAWLGFTLPSAIFLTSLALGLGSLGLSGEAGFVHGLKVVAVAVVAQAVWGMAKNLAPDPQRATLALAAAILLLLWPSVWAQFGAVVAGGLIGWRWLARPAETRLPSRTRITIPLWLSWLSVALLGVGLLGLPVVAATSDLHSLALFDAFFRAGALVFGGGHVVLPLLEQALVVPGWVSADQFLVGYGAAQAVPGPLFTFAAYLGASSGPAPNGISGAILATVAIFLPSFLLLWAVLPLWERLRSAGWAQAVLRGINASVVGLLLAALYDPVITNAIRGPQDVALALTAFAALHLWRIAPWAVVLAGAGVGAIFL